MPWHGIEGHDPIVARFREALARGRLASTFLFIGPAGIGKRAFALKLAQALLCQTRPESALDPCERCPACVQVAAVTHPDLEIVSKPRDKIAIPVETFIGDREHRMQEGLCHRIALKPFMGGRKIAIIDDADFLNQEGANALLKTLEEPPPKSVLILIGTSADKQLPTIRSRAQIIRFHPLPDEIVARLLVDRGIVADATEAGRLASYSGGSIEQAAELADAELWAFRTALLGALARWPVEGFKTAQDVSSFIDDAGKEAPARRARSRLLIGFAIEFYRALVRRLHGHAGVEHADLGALVEQATRNGWTPSTAVAALERSLEAINHVDRNANQATMVESWFDDLAGLSVGQAIGLTVRPMA